MTPLALTPLPTRQAACLIHLPFTLGPHGLHGLHGLQLVGHINADPSLLDAAQRLHERLT